MSDRLQLALETIGAVEDDVLVCRETDEHIIIVVRQGQKYTLPLSGLIPPPPPPESEPEPEPEAAPEPVTGLDSLSYRELQALAKEHDIPANQSGDDLLAALEEVGNDGD